MNNPSRFFSHGRPWGRALRVTFVGILLMSAVVAPVGQAAAAGPDKPRTGPQLRPVPPAPVPRMDRPQPNPSRALPPAPPVAPQFRGTHLVDPVDLKVLVITGNGDDGNQYELPAINAELDRIGVPHDLLMASTHTLNGTSYVQAGDTLDGALTRLLSNGVVPSSGGHGYYEGIILTTGSLLFCDATGCQYGFTQPEWTALWNYEAAFGIRQVTHYTSPGVGFPTNYCLSPTSDGSVGPATTFNPNPTLAPFNATLTSAGATLFAYLQPTVQINISYAYVYKAVADPNNAANGNTLTPLVTSSDGSVLVSTCKFGDGRENLAMTFNNNPDDAPDVNFIRSLLMSYGVVNWVTRGHFLGERHVNQAVQVDDLFLDGALWNTRQIPAGAPSFDPGADCVGTQSVCPTVRMSGSDINNLVKWQGTGNTKTSAPQFQVEFAFNGDGTVPANLDPKFTPDTLTPAVKSNQKSFNYVNHTYSHINLDSNCVAWDNANPANCTATASPTESDILSQLQQNDAVARSIGFTDYTKNVFVNPDISGLSNTIAQQALYDFGIRFEISDTSRPGQANPSPNVGIPNAVQPAILEVPRRSTNLFYNLYRPQDWVSEYNCFYYQGGIQVNGSTVHCGGSTFDQYRYLTTPIDYNGIISHESDSLLSYLLRWDIDPGMFHQENLIQYGNGKTLLTDLLTATFNKYHALYKLPIRNLRELEVGGKMLDRAAYNSSGLTADMIPCGTAGATPSVTLRSPTAVTVPVTGVKNGSTAEVYGGQNISYLNLVANTPVTVPIVCP